MTSYLNLDFRKKKSIKKILKNPDSEKENEFKLKSLYLAKTAHELKNVFLTISSFIENKGDTILSTIKKENEDISSHNFLKSLCDFGMNLIFEITEISKNEGKFKTIKEEKKQNEEFDLIKALNFCVKMFQSRAIFEKKNINIKLTLNNVPKDKKIKVISEMRLKQVIINLISNSYKFTIKGLIELSIEKINENLRIKISDSGIGFSEKEMGKLNQPFHLIEKNQFLNKHGSGLGLFICKEILSSYNMELKFSSERGKGTQFWFDLKDNNNIFDPSVFLSNSLKDLMNEINNGEKDFNPSFKSDNSNKNFIDEEEKLIDDESYENNKNNKSFKKVNISNSSNNDNNSNNNNYDNAIKQNSLYRKVRSINIFNKRSNYQMNNINDSNNNSYHQTSKTLMKNFHISKQNIKIAKTLLNGNIGNKEHILRSFSQSERDNKCIDKNKQNLKIIICDDDSFSALSIRKLIIKYFEKINENLPDIFYVPNGIECLNSAYNFLIKDNPIDVILMDMNMPFLNGFSTCKLLKNILEMNDIKIYLQSSQIINIKECDADGFFDKPLSMEALKEIFSNVLNEKKNKKCILN